jgi:hypothetical protein
VNVEFTRGFGTKQSWVLFKASCSEGAEGTINPLNSDLNPIYQLLALLGAHHILNVSRIRVNSKYHDLYT